MMPGTVESFLQGIADANRLSFRIGAGDDVEQIELAGGLAAIEDLRARCAAEPYVVEAAPMNTWQITGAPATASPCRESPT